MQIGWPSVALSTDEKLTFEVQPELAARLHYADRPGMLGVERE